MPLSDLKYLHDKNPEHFFKLLRSMARRRCDSLKIEGLHVTEDDMLKALESDYQRRVDHDLSPLAA